MEREQAPDTIVALGTAPGRAALAVLRLSGPAASAIAGRVFERDRGGALTPRRPLMGWFLDRAGQRMDQGLALFFPGPRSYTGEDLVELMAHGAPAVVQELIAACVATGARPAQPGEFTLRALRHGKVTLAQAEAVADLVEAATLEQARLAARQLAGEVSATIGPLAERTVDLLADVEAQLDFAEGEQDLGEPLAVIGRRCANLADDIDDALGASESARRVREGARVVLLGPPNAGKSSLFNRLVGEERVIVDAAPGTTRDLIEEVIVIDGLPIVVIDGAGVGEGGSAADREGMRRALTASAKADLVLDVYDLTGGHRPAATRGPRRLPVGTHADLTWSAPPTPESLLVSSVTGEGVPELRSSIAAALRAPGASPPESVALATERHRECARRARDGLRAAEKLAAAGQGLELVAVELHEATQALAEILGAVGPEDLLGRIFARFCVGK